MANTQALSNQFRVDIMTSGFNLSTGVKTIRAALYLASGTINATKLVYGGTIGSVADTSEASGTGYTAGGVVVTNATSPTGANTTPAGDAVYWTPSASIVYTGVTLTAFDTVVLFDGTTPFHAIGAWNFGSQTIVAGNVTLTMPTNNATTGLVRLL